MKEYRKQEGLTQKQLGELLGVKQTDISFVESGRRPPSPELEGAFWSLWKASPEPELPASSTGEAGRVLLGLMAAARDELGHPMSPEELEGLGRA